MEHSDSVSRELSSWIQVTQPGGPSKQKGTMWEAGHVHKGRHHGGHGERSQPSYPVHSSRQDSRPNKESWVLEARGSQEPGVDATVGSQSDVQVGCFG